MCKLPYAKGQRAMNSDSSQLLQTTSLAKYQNDEQVSKGWQLQNHQVFH